MPSRRKTVAEARFPLAPEFQSVLAAWTSDSAIVLLRFIWQAYDLLRLEVLDHIDVGHADEDLERSVTQLLEPRVKRVMTGDEPFDIQHGSYEPETRQPPPAQPPQYDLAFILRANPRVMWPIEAKVVRHLGDVGRYVQEINNNFLTARYAPFSREGAMLGYLLIRDVDLVFNRIAEALPSELEAVSALGDRPHRRSRHIRLIPTRKFYPREFHCHHLLMILSPAEQ